MAEENKEEVTSEQESPTVEETQVEQPTESTDKGVEATDDKEKNWRALREENERLKKQLNGTKEPSQEEVADVTPLNTVRNSPAVSFYLSPEVQNQMQFEEFKAEQSFPELEKDSLFADTVQGKYRRALDEYVTQLANGVTPKFAPSVYRIAKETESKWKERFGSVQKQAEQEGAKKAKESVGAKEATVEAEGRSDRGRVAQEAADISKLRRLTQMGDKEALAARLSKLK